VSEELVRGMTGQDLKKSELLLGQSPSAEPVKPTSKDLTDQGLKWYSGAACLFRVSNSEPNKTFEGNRCTELVDVLFFEQQVSKL